MGLRRQFWVYWELNRNYFWLDQLIFIDEVGFTAKTADRTTGRALRGNRAHGQVTGQRQFKFTGNLAISLGGVLAFNLITGQ